MKVKKSLTLDSLEQYQKAFREYQIKLNSEILSSEELIGKIIAYTTEANAIPANPKKLDFSYIKWTEPISDLIQLKQQQSQRVYKKRPSQILNTASAYTRTPSQAVSALDPNDSPEDLFGGGLDKQISIPDRTEASKGGRLKTVTTKIEKKVEMPVTTQIGKNAKYIITLATGTQLILELKNKNTYVYLDNIACPIVFAHHEISKAVNLNLLETIKMYKKEGHYDLLTKLVSAGDIVTQSWFAELSENDLINTLQDCVLWILPIFENSHKDIQSYELTNTIFPYLIPLEARIVKVEPDLTFFPKDIPNIKPYVRKMTNPRFKNNTQYFLKSEKTGYLITYSSNINSPPWLIRGNNGEQYPIYLILSNQCTHLILKKKMTVDFLKQSFTEGHYTEQLPENRLQKAIPTFYSWFKKKEIPLELDITIPSKMYDSIEDIDFKNHYLIYAPSQIFSQITNEDVVNFLNNVSNPKKLIMTQIIREIELLPEQSYQEQANINNLQSNFKK